ncbi:unnamed protein product [Caenorhabditis nigoni]
MTDVVKLDVGGTVFKTTKSTLTKFDGFFRTMFETPIPVPRDESGAIFVDRSPKHFDLIPNFMRDGHKEAEYYLLDGLVESCNPKPEFFPNTAVFRSLTPEVRYSNVADYKTEAVTFKTFSGFLDDFLQLFYRLSVAVLSTSL